MRWLPPHHSPPLRIAIVGGGIASFVAGITLREKLPNAAITLYSAACETMIGGQLASWSEQGYPVEHGLHALFGFYDHILPILKKIGAYENLTRSKEHIFIHERGAIHRFDLRTWPATYRGFTDCPEGAVARRRSRDLQACARCQAKGHWAFSMLMISAICGRSHACTGCLSRCCKAGSSGSSTKPPSMRRRNSRRRSRSSRSTRSSPSGGTTTSTCRRRQSIIAPLQRSFHSLLPWQDRVQPETHRGSHGRRRRPGSGARFRESGYTGVGFRSRRTNTFLRSGSRTSSR